MCGGFPGGDEALTALPIDVSPEEAEVMLDGFEDFAFYAQTYWRVATQSHGYQPFILRPAQVRVHEAYERQMAERGFVRMNVLKCRRAGVSTYVTKRAHHYGIIRPAVVAMSIAHNTELPNEWLMQCKGDRDRTAKLRRPEPAPAGNLNMLRYSNGSRYIFASAQSGFPALGDTIHFLHISEIGRWDKPPVSKDPQDILYPLKPSIPTGDDRKGTVIVRESTGVIKGDYWSRDWGAGKLPDDDFENLFLPWFLVPEYKQDAAEVLELSKYEQDLVKIGRQYGVELSHAQLAWRRHELRQGPFYGNVELWGSEYPATEDESFRSPGISVYTGEQIAAARATVRDCVWAGEISPEDNPVAFRLLPGRAGSLKVWDHDPQKARPNKRWHYAIGADNQWGQRDTADYDCAFVECAETGKVCAEIHGRWQLGTWARMLAALGHYYSGADGPALLAPERNSVGDKGGVAVIRALLGQAGNNWSYPNLYVSLKGARLGSLTVNDYGWDTNAQTKPELQLRSMDMFARPGWVFDWADALAVDQLASIIVHDNNTVGAPKGANDDRWMARLITAWMADELRARFPPTLVDLGPDLPVEQQRILRHIKEADLQDAEMARQYTGEDY